MTENGSEAINADDAAVIICIAMWIAVFVMGVRLVFF